MGFGKILLIFFHQAFDLAQFQIAHSGQHILPVQFFRRGDLAFEMVFPVRADIQVKVHDRHRQRAQFLVFVIEEALRGRLQAFLIPAFIEVQYFQQPLVIDQLVEIDAFGE